LRKEYLAAENQILKAQLKPPLRLTDAERVTLAEIANNWTDNSYINQYTRNYDAMAGTVAEYTPDHVAAITGVPAEKIMTAAEWIGTSRETISLFVQGVCQSMGATDTVRMICAMHLVMGKIGRPGSAPFSITGQATAMSNREAGASSALKKNRI